MREPDDTKDMLEYARQLQAEASDDGFDWPDAEGVLDKLNEEVAEIREAVVHGDLEHAGRELGDLLLAASHLSDFLGIAPREALLGATKRFAARYDVVQELAAQAGLQLKSCSQEALDRLWEEAKIRLHQSLAKPLDKAADFDADSTSC